MVSRAQLEQYVKGAWDVICTVSGVDGAEDALPKGELRLLGSSVKSEKGRGYGVETAILYLAPGRESGRNVCPFSSPSCEAACLGHSAGRMRMSQGEKARRWKTALRFGCSTVFFELLHKEIEAHERRARSKGMQPAVRLDGSSDLGDAERVAKMHPGVMFYDYTKTPVRMERYLEGRVPENVHLTFSYSGENWDTCGRVLEAGGGVAVVFDVGEGESLPERWRGWHVVDGDEHDARFLDESVDEHGKGYIVGLRAKGAAKGAVGDGSFVCEVLDK